MPKRRRLQQVETIVAVQRARRSEAEQAVSLARAASDAARAGAEAAAERLGQADQDWQDHLDGGDFDPLRGRWLGDRVMIRLSEEAEAKVRAQLAQGMAERRQDEWQFLEAQVRSGERRAGELKSQVAHAREEKQLQRLADQVTYKRWAS